MLSSVDAHSKSALMWLIKLMEGQDSVIFSAFQMFRLQAQLLLGMRLLGGRKLPLWERRLDFRMSMKTWQAVSQKCWWLNQRKCCYIRKNKMCHRSTESRSTWLVLKKKTFHWWPQSGMEDGTKEPRQNPLDPTLTPALFAFSFFPKTCYGQHGNFGIFFFLFETLTQNLFLYIDFHRVKMLWAVKKGLRKVIFHIISNRFWNKSTF